MARILRLLIVGFLASPLLAQGPVSSGSLNGKPVEQILVSGLQAVEMSDVLRQMKSKVGEPYSDSNIAKDHELLDRMSLFSKIAIDPQPGASGVIVRVELKETQPYLPYPSISVTAEQGLTVGGGLKSTDFLRSGANLSIAARFGGATEFDVIAFSSWRPRNTWWWKVDYFLRDRDNQLDHFHELSNDLDLQAGRQVTDQLRLGGRFHYMWLKSDIPGITLSPSNHDIIPGVGLVAEYDNRDSWTSARRGWWNSADATANGLGADGNYWTFNIDVRRYQPLAERHDIAIFSLLTMQTGIVGIDIPIHEDFHIGGTNSMRGWDVDARHGKNQWLNTVEYRYDLIKVRDFSIKGINFYAGLEVAVFADAGSAWNTGEEFSRNFIAGTGFGIRLKVPYVNVLRFDFGFGQPGQGLLSHVGIMEKAVYQRRRIR
jgi:outer membrane protein assembly factor BamA